MSLCDRMGRLAERLTPDRDPSDALTNEQFNWLMLQMHKTLLVTTAVEGVTLPDWLLAEGKALEYAPLSPIPDEQLAEVRAWNAAHPDPTYDDMTDEQILESLRVMSAEIASLHGRSIPT